MVNIKNKNNLIGFTIIFVGAILVFLEPLYPRTPDYVSVLTVIGWTEIVFGVIATSMPLILNKPNGELSNVYILVLYGQLVLSLGMVSPARLPGYNGLIMSMGIGLISLGLLLHFEDEEYADVRNYIMYFSLVIIAVVIGATEIASKLPMPK